MTAELPSQNYSMTSRNKTERISSNRQGFQSVLSSNRHPESIFHPEGKTAQSLCYTRYVQRFALGLSSLSEYKNPVIKTLLYRVNIVNPTPRSSGSLPFTVQRRLPCTHTRTHTQR